MVADAREVSRSKENWNFWLLGGGWHGIALRLIFDVFTKTIMQLEGQRVSAALKTDFRLHGLAWNGFTKLLNMEWRCFTISIQC